MSILTGPAICELVTECNAIIEPVVKALRIARACTALPFLSIDPFDPETCGPNSYDVHIGDRVLIYDPSNCYLDSFGNSYLDSRKPNPTVEIEIPKDGLILVPGVLYLAALVENIECHGLVPWLDGRSSIGRLGIGIHKTAGRADDGWCGRLTCEIDVLYRVKIYPGQRIGQLTFMTTTGSRQPYKGKYLGDREAVASRLHQDKDNQEKPT